MSRGLFWTIALLVLAGGLSLLFYLLFNVAPIDERGAMDMGAVGLFFLGLGLAAIGVGSATARILHRQWPALAGAPGGMPAPTAALRQGFLFAVALLALAGLAIAQQLDIAFIVVTLIMLGLTEAFIQSRTA